MKVSSAIQTPHWLELVIDGKPAWVDTKFSLLSAGVAVLLDPEDEPPHWDEAASAVAVTDPTAPEGIRIAGGTTDPVVVVLARRYYDAKNDDDTVFHLGRVSVPGLEEATVELPQWKELLAAS